MKTNFNKKAAMEMSMGTIVTIVLLVAVLILGLVLVQNIFRSAKSVVDMTDEQLRSEVEKIFSEQKEFVIYPGTRQVSIKQGEINGVGLGIRNLLTGEAGKKKFSYEVVVSDSKLMDKCGVSESEAEGWITTGQSEKNIPIPSGGITTGKVLFDIPVGSPLCTLRYRINVDAEGTSYASDFFDVIIKAK